jgi:phosphomannomutase
MIKLIIFDLDGTLAPSKTRISDQMADLICQLLFKFKVAIISGGKFLQFEKQVLPFLKNDEKILNNLYICPTWSTKMYVFRDKKWDKLYSENLLSEEKKEILKVLDNALKDVNFKPENTWGDIIEDRDTQITFSALGQEAPVSEKELYDPTYEKRLRIKEIIDNNLKGYNITIEGKTSIDITKSGIDVAYGINKLKDMLNIEIGEMIFVGDAIFPGGNNYNAKNLGVDCVETTGPKNTEEIIKEMIVGL